MTGCVNCDACMVKENENGDGVLICTKFAKHQMYKDQEDKETASKKMFCSCDDQRKSCPSCSI